MSAFEAKNGARIWPQIVVETVTPARMKVTVLDDAEVSALHEYFTRDASCEAPASDAEPRELRREHTGAVTAGMLSASFGALMIVAGVCGAGALVMLAIGIAVSL